MEKLVILDFNTASVNVYDVDSKANIDEEYISNLGYHTSECSWMFAEELNITYHKEVLR